MNVQFVFLLILFSGGGVYAKIRENDKPIELSTNIINEELPRPKIEKEPTTESVDPSDLWPIEDVTEFTTTSSPDFEKTTDSVDTTTATWPTQRIVDDSTVDSSTTEDTTSTSSTEPSTTTTKTPCPSDLKVQNLKVVPSSFEASLTWKPPERTECVEFYLIYLNGEVYNTTETKINITDLNACNEYSIAVSILYEENLGGNVTEIFQTKLPLPFNYSVTNIGFNETEALIITWEPPPDKVLQCVKSYDVRWRGSTDFFNGQENVPRSQTSKELIIIGCIKYDISIVPIAENGTKGVSTNASHTAKALPTKPPIIVESSLKIDKTSISLTWKTDTDRENLCPLQEIIVTCVGNRDIVEELDIRNQNPNFTYPMTIKNLSPFTNYTCEGLVVNKGGNSTTQNFFIRTLEEVPSAPRNIRVEDILSESFKVKWTEPELIPGIMTSYSLVITNKGPKFESDDCHEKGYVFHIDNIDPNQFNYEFKNASPYRGYEIELYGIDGAGNGSSTKKEFTTKAANPNLVKNVVINFNYLETEEYSAYAIVEFQRSCTNGPFRDFTIHYKGVRDGFTPVEYTNTTTSSRVNFTVLPERKYSIDVTTNVEGGFSSKWSEPQLNATKPGVPPLPIGLKVPKANETNKAFFTLQKDTFNDTNGAILHYFVIVLPSTATLPQTYGFWDGENWPPLPDQTLWSQNFSNPFLDGEKSKVLVIQSLKEDTSYILIVRALTAATYRDSPRLLFRTQALDQLDLGLILGLTFGILAVVVIGGFIIVLKRRKKEFVEEEEKRSSVSVPAPITCKKFGDYYESIQENNNIIKNQYSTIGNLSKELGLSTSYALLPENKRKNRYTNILPYDDTRVKLQIDEDDEIGSDYINASYIKGFSNRIEYIATQGPLESTSKDFWKMIWQENVTIIVMVSQFIEQSKEKCYQYFPNNHEKMSFGESFEIRCSTELHFGTYCVRTLQLRKDIEQRNVYHMQFLEWPDFGVPQSTDNMLEFCHQLREKAIAEGGLIAVHCSAGVGRTGTLIALDILLQTIDHHRDINIYKTVLDLRKQRINMVQTEKQYMFIHSCIKEYLEMSTNQNEEQVQDRVYENVDVLKSSMKKNLIEIEVESAL